MRRITTLLLIGAPIMAVLAGCGSHDGNTASAPTPAPTPAVTTSAALPGATTSIGSPTSPLPTAATTAAAPGSGGQGGGTPRCHTGDLKVSVAADEGGGAAGTSYESLVFKNASKHPCTLTGYPGVSFVAGAQGTQVNTGFTRDPTESHATVRLVAGKSAHATIRVPNWQNFPENLCKPVSVRGFRIYPPDETASIFVSQPQKACSVKGQGVGGVAPITLAAA
jgi:Protein of unknown function (DUF4232)